VAFHPTVLEVLWAIDDGFIGFVADLPGWLPIRTHQRALAERKSLRSASEQFIMALEKKGIWLGSRTAF
jgi:hypothetical protein